jgi:hypothetical protein
MVISLGQRIEQRVFDLFVQRFRIEKRHGQARKIPGVHRMLSSLDLEHQNRMDTVKLSAWRAPGAAFHLIDHMR